MTTSKKIDLTSEQTQECIALNDIYCRKKSELSLSQEKIAIALGISQGGVGHYFKQRTALNVRRAIGFAKILQVKIEDFSPRLAKEASYGVADSDVISSLVEIMATLPPIHAEEMLENAKTKARLLKVDSEGS